MKALHAFALTLLLSTAPVVSGCASAKLEPANADQKVANKPHAAATKLKGGAVLQVEADSWMADDRVKDEVTAMKVTFVNHSKKDVSIDYHSFVLVANSGKFYKPVNPHDIPIRGATRSIGLPADTIITRTSDSAINAPSRTESEKEQIRQRLVDQALKSENVPSGERSVGYIYFERVPASVKDITFRGSVRDTASGASSEEAALEFQPRQYQ